MPHFQTCLGLQENLPLSMAAAAAVIRVSKLTQTKDSWNHFHVLPKSSWCPSALLPVQMFKYGHPPPPASCRFPASVCLCTKGIKGVLNTVFHASLFNFL